MKKIFSLFSALLLTVSMWGATDTNYTMTLVENFNAVDNGDGTMRLSFDAVGKSGSSTYYYEIAFNITKTSAGFVGTFGTEAGTLDKFNSKVDWVNASHTSISAYRKIEYAAKPSTVTIALVEGYTDKYTLSGQIIAQKKDNGDNGSDKIYNFTNMEFMYGPYAIEPAKADFSFTGTEYGKKFKDGVISFVVADAKYNEIDLLINAQQDALAAGTYTVGEQIVASTGYEDYMPTGSCAYVGMDSYCIVGGSVTFAFSEDKKTMTMNGSLTTGHGSVITLSASGANPWYVPEPETIELTVSKVSVSGKTNLTLSINATPNSFTLGLVGTTLDGITIENINYKNTYVDLDEYGYQWSDADSEASGNSLSIVATGNPDEYKLNASITCLNKNTYVMKDVIFTYHIPTPWDSEVARQDFTLSYNYMEATNQTKSKGWVLCEFMDEDWNMISLAFPTDTFTLAPGKYVVKDNAVKGEILASAGKVGLTYEPSKVFFYENYSDVYLFVRSGEIEVSYAGDSIFMKGELTTYRGTKATVNCSGKSAWAVPSYAVTYGANISVAPDSIVSGKMTASGTEVVFTASDLSATGYGFAGFFQDEAYSDSVATGSVEGLVYTVSVYDTAISVYAKYAAIVYDITYNVFEGEPVTSPLTYTVESETFALPTPVKSGYDFKGWFTNEACTEGETTQVVKGTTGDLVFYAKWEKQSGTGMNSISGNAVKATKVMHHGQMIIKHGNMRYNILGAKF